MVGAIASTGGVYHSPYLYPMSRQTRELAGAERAAVRPAQAAGLRVVAARRAQPDVPVQPAGAVKPVRDNVFNKDALLHYMANDPVEGAARSRIRYSNH